MDKREKEKLSRYGKLVWDFANSKTTDDILTSFFENLQSAFYFSNDFATKALKRFPTEKMTIDTLSIEEKKLLRMLLRRNNILKSCNDTFHSGSYHIDHYDPIASIFKITKSTCMCGDDINAPETIEETILIPLTEINEFIDKPEIEIDHLYGLCGIGVHINRLVELCIKIEAIKTEATTHFTKIEKMAEAYPSIYELHKHVKVTQKNLKHVILQIIEADNAYEITGFKSILSRYNTIQKTKYVVNEDKNLVEIGPFMENYFLDGDSLSHKDQIFNAPISYCLVEFLKKPGYSGKERISECKLCHCNFSKSKLSDKQVYCPVCSRKNKMTPEERAKYMKEYRATPARKRARAKAKHEEKIKHLMKEAGKTRKQAETIVDAER